MFYIYKHCVVIFLKLLSSSIMLKRLLVTPLLFLTVTICKSQDLPIDPETKKISYSEVIEIEGVAKEELYKRAKAWFVTGTGASKLALELEDLETGKLAGKVNSAVSSKNPPAGMFEVGVITNTITILIKDGRYKYVFTDFIHESGGVDKVISSGPLEQKKTPAKAITGNMPTQYQWNQIKKETDKRILSQVESLKKALGNKSTEMDF